MPNNILEFLIMVHEERILQLQRFKTRKLLLESAKYPDIGRVSMFATRKPCKKESEKLKLHQQNRR